MVAITINVLPETLERAKALAARDGRRLDEVVSELATEAIVDEGEPGDGPAISSAWEREIAKRLTSIDDGTETFKPASQAIADIRKRFGW
jgi:hypothetical protein